MSTTINGVTISSIMLATEQPRENTREIGETSEAADGTTVTTRLTKKNDLSFNSVPIDLTDAHVWMAFLSGEGERWNFDADLYGCKGTGPSSATNATQSAGSAKYGAGKLSVGATTGTITWAAVAMNEFGAVNGWLVMVFRFEGAVWVHYIVRNDGAKWVDGVRNDAASTTWLTVNSTTGDVTIANATGSPVLYDDLVVMPFAALDEWIAGLYDYHGDQTWSALPYLAARGDFVQEQTTRVVLGRVASSSLMQTGTGPMRTLAVELVAK